jgi:hypothetical protein
VVAVDAATAVSVDMVADAARTTLAPLIQQRKVFAQLLAATCLIAVGSLPEI